MPVVRLERLFDSATMQHAEQILDLCFSEGNIEASIAGPENKAKREKVRALFRSVYENYLGRSLRRGEKAVFDAAIFCFFLVMIGRSFKEIVSIRYNWLLGNGRGGLNFLQPAVKLPKIDFDKPYPLYYPYHARDKVSYDLVVFDTYDYLDQVISFSLADVFIAIFDKVFERKKDARAESMVNFFKYGTEDKKTILLLRYGFSAEQISEIKDYVSSIDEGVISFEDAIQQASEEIKERVEWYR